MLCSWTINALSFFILFIIFMRKIHPSALNWSRFMVSDPYNYFNGLSVVSIYRSTMIGVWDISKKNLKPPSPYPSWSLIKTTIEAHGMQESLCTICKFTRDLTRQILFNYRAIEEKSEKILFSSQTSLCYYYFQNTLKSVIHNITYLTKEILSHNYSFKPI